MKHISFVHEGFRNYKCDLCDKGFNQPGHLKRHINSVHEQLKNHKCGLCEKAYSDLGKVL